MRSRSPSALQAAISADCHVGGHDVFMTASIGIVLDTDAYERPDDLLRDADTAMYHAKTAGGTVTRCSTPACAIWPSNAWRSGPS